MKRLHFEALGPVCPVCRGAGRGEQPLAVGQVVHENNADVLEGILRCTGPTCLREYPIIDGVPILVADLRGYVTGQVDQITARDDLSAVMESLIGDCCGPGSPYVTTREHLSAYAWDHYADLDPSETGDAPAPGSARRVLKHGLDLASPVPGGPVIDVGCSVGRTSFELAAVSDELVLGVDLSFSMLQVARRVVRNGRVRYPRRRVGVVYEQRDFQAEFDCHERVDFWACDATALPFPPGTFGLSTSLNVVDCVQSPVDALREQIRVMVPGGRALVTTPYDWSPGATPMEAWLGGHSQRGEGGGASEPVLRALLTPESHPASLAGVRLVAEIQRLAWQVRLHDRSVMTYDVHVAVAETLAANG